MQINDYSGWILLDDKPAAWPRPPLLLGLVAIVFAECALLAVATGYLVIEIIVDVPASFASAIALTVLTAMATIWLAVIGVNLLGGRPWTRGATVTWQVLQIAVAIGCFQGMFARPDLGWLLLLPAAAAIGLVFSRPVIRWTARREDD